MTRPSTATSGVGAAAPTPAVLLTSITKRYGAVVACDNVDLQLHPGQIHGILGENGAGKSTLMKILIGLVQPDSGTIILAGRQTRIHDPQTAADLGIGMVHQHLSLVNSLSVWENVLLGDHSRLDRRRARQQVAQTAEHYGLDIDPDRRVGDLSAGLRQRVELIKCLRRDPAILILDEPTSVLTPAESEQLFTTLRDVVAREQRAVALVSHKLAEVLHATDDITIMRQGRVVGWQRTSDATAAALARAMVGREVSLRTSAAALGAVTLTESESIEAGLIDPRAGLTTDRDPNLGPASVGHDNQRSDGPAMLSIRDAVVMRDGIAVLDHFNIEVHAGEIVGVAGVEGNGQRELGDLMSSLIHLNGGSVVIDGTTIDTRRAGCMARHDVAVIPEDRHDSGCVLDMSVAENLLIDRPGSVARFGFVNATALRRQAQALMAEFEIQGAGPDAPMRSLSGGNQQRVILARELSHSPKVLVAAQPTRGLDVGAIEYMSGRLRDAAAAGIAVLLVSTELDEILDLSDRIVVMSRGRVIGQMDCSEATSQRLGLLMGGVVTEEAEA